MPFTQTPMNYAAQYGQELANAYPYLSYYADLWNQGESQRFRPLRGKTVYIPSMTTSGAKAVNRDQITGVFNRNFNVDWQACDLEMDREWDTLVDPMDMVETNEVATIANVTRTFNELQKIPEQDAYMSSKLAGFAKQFGGVDTTTLTAANILAQWDAYLEYMTNARINRDRVRCKMTPAVYKLLKEAAGITRFVDAATGIRNIDRNVGRLDGVLIEEVPADMMKTAYDFTNGWAEAAGASQIGLIMYDPYAVAAPIIYDTSMMSAPTAQSKGKWLYYERYYYGTFALNQRGAGFMANIGSAPTLGTLNVTSVAGTGATGDTIVTATGDVIGMTGFAPDGFALYYSAGNNSAPSVTYGAALPAGATWTEMTANPITLNSQTAGKYVTVALVNKQKGVAVAAGSALEVVKT